MQSISYSSSNTKQTYFILFCPSSKAATRQSNGRAGSYRLRAKVMRVILEDGRLIGYNYLSTVMRSTSVSSLFTHGYFFRHLHFSYVTIWCQGTSKLNYTNCKEWFWLIVQIWILFHLVIHSYRFIFLEYNRIIPNYIQ